MKVLVTAFYGKYNASNILLNKFDGNVDKLVLTNSFEKLKNELARIELEKYDLIVMFGINKNLKDEIRIEEKAKLDDILSTSLDVHSICEFSKNYMKTTINKIPTKYLCNCAYYNALRKNKNTIFMHIPGFSKITNIDQIIKMLKDFVESKIYESKI